MNEPKSVEQEEEVLGGMMNNDACFYEGVAKLNEEHFTTADTKKIFSMLARSNSRQTVTMLKRVTDEPRLRSAIHVYDGKYINHTEFDHSMKLLEDTYYKRQLYYTINKVKNHFDEADYDDIVSIIQDDINSFSYDDSGSNIIFAEDRADIGRKAFQERVANPNDVNGIPYSVEDYSGQSSGFPSLDVALDGANGGDLIMIAAKTGVGKTAFALNLARFFSFRQQYWGYYMNTEMRLEEMEARLLAPIANVKANEILYGRLEGTNEERQNKYKAIDSAFDMYEKSPLVMSRLPNLPLHKAKGLAQQVMHQVKNKNKNGKLDYIIVDYVGRMEIKDYYGNTWDELYEITQQLKVLATILDVPVIMLAQRNQAGDVEGAKKMMNECDAVLYFEETDEEDQEYIREYVTSKRMHLVNYKILKKKVRRDENQAPIYVSFDKTKNFINEVR